MKKVLMGISLVFFMQSFCINFEPTDVKYARVIYEDGRSVEIGQLHSGLSLKEMLTLAAICIYLAPVVKGVFQNVSKLIMGHIDTPIGCIDIKGPLRDVSEYVQQIQALSNNPNIKGLLIKIDSPGGNAGAGDIIAREIEIAKSKIPVVALVENICASAAYQIASSCDKIVSSASSMVGGIGTFMKFHQYQNTPTHISFGLGGGMSAKATEESVKAGKFKTAGDPYTGLSKEERQYFQELVDEEYDAFCKHVAKNRGLELNKLSEWADGRVFSGRMVKGSLVDQIGGTTEAKKIIEKLIKMRGGIVKGKIVLIEQPSKGFFQSLSSPESYSEFISNVIIGVQERLLSNSHNNAVN